MTSTATRTVQASTFVKGFYREGADGFSTYFSDEIGDPDALAKELRRQGVFAPSGALPVVVMVNDDGHIPGNSRGCVAVMADDGHRLRSIEVAILALESVRDGLREMGHGDDES